MVSVFSAPTLDPLDREVLRMVEDLRQQMRHNVAEPRRWAGSLRRMAFARAVQASNSIEGYNASLNDVVAAVDGEPTIQAGEETSLALAGYRDAMTYVLQVAQDPDGEVDEGLIKALHFMMLRHDLAKSPGRWRPGYIAVRREATGEIVYEGPDSEAIPDLTQALVDALEDEGTPVLVRAAMAHLNLVMVHPFRDGNGRMARCLQTLVLAREQIVAPVFSSIEEYLGHNTDAYHDVLAQVGQGTWKPQNDAAPWIKFCLTAHYRQATTHLRRIEEAELLWRECAEMAEAHRLPERVVGGMMEAALGFRLRNSTYRSIVELTADQELSELTATRELKAMVDAGFLAALGERRGRHYLAEPVLLDVQRRIRVARPQREDHDPYAKAQEALQLKIGD